jgi:hypothetical protein
MTPTARQRGVSSADQSSGLDSGEKRDAARGASARASPARGTSMRLLLWALVALGVLTLMLVLSSGLDAHGADERTSLRVAPSARWEGAALNRSAPNRSIAGRYGAYFGQKRLTHPPSVARTRPPSHAVPVRGYDALVPPARRPRPGGRCRTFRVAPRKDFMVVMAPMFVELGLCPSETPSFDVYWGFAINTISSFRSSKLAPNREPANVILNSIPLMMQVVGEKPSIASLQGECTRLLRRGRGKSNQLYAPLWCEFTQRGFNARRDKERGSVNVEYDALRDYVRKKSKARRFPAFWIRKAVTAYSQKGIRLMHMSESNAINEGALIKWVEEHMPAGDYTLQEYLAAPMQWKDRKFDMRALAMMTSVQPLRFYTLDRAYPKIATRAYTTNLTKLEDSCVHFRMPVCSKPMKPYPPSSDSPLFRQNLRPPLKSDTHWDEELYPAVYKVMLRVVLLARREVRAPPSS